MVDEIVRYVTDAGYAAALIRADDTARRIAVEQHGLRGQASGVLASGVVSALAFGTRLKGPGLLTLSHHNQGVFNHWRCDAIGMGSVRGLVLPTTHERLATWDAEDDLLGPGVLTVTRQIPERDPYRTDLEIAEGSVAHAANRYLSDSEQVPAAVALDVRCDDSGPQHAAALYLERLPGGDETHILNGRMAALREHPTSLDLLGRADQVLDGLCPEATFRELHRYAVGFHCPCSRDRYIATLRGFPANQLSDLSNGAGVIETVCDFCRSRYDIPLDEVMDGK